MRVLVTGAEGFLGRNLCVRLAEVGRDEVLPIGRGASEEALREAAAAADCVVHLAGVNRPPDPADYAVGNTGTTEQLCAILAATGRKQPVIFSSSTQAALDNAYGCSKRGAEEALEAYSKATGAPVHLFRLTNVFGKWSRPNYNSAVATFCHNISRGLPVTIHDPASPLHLVYVDDVVGAFLEVLEHPYEGGGFCEAGPVYATTVGEVVETLRAVHAGRETLVTPRVGCGLVRFGSGSSAATCARRG
jgi:UDP-2-acetamido-2,6-beta-L-arabino-hexul-4-ose reductase